MEAILNNVVSLNKEIILRESQLKTLVNDISIEIWNKEVTIPIETSKRLKTSLGYFMTTVGQNAKAVKLVFSHELIDGTYKLVTLVDVIKHELAHYHLFIQGVKGYSDGNREFENELKRIGAHSTRVVSGAGKYHVCYCSCCGKLIMKGSEKKVKNRCTKSYISGCCRTKIRYGGVKYYEDNTVERATAEPQYKLENLKSVKKLLGKEVNDKKINNIPTKKAASLLANTKTEANRNINDIVIPGKKGVTGTQIIIGINNAVDNNRPDDLVLIKEHYPQLFEHYIRYITKKRLAYMNNIGII